MFKFSTAKLVAAMVVEEQEGLNLLERCVFFLFKCLGSIRRAVKERWLFSQRSMLEFYKAGIRNYLVLGAGVLLPTHIHRLFTDVRVLYVDNDEEVVREAQKLLAGRENVRYVWGDLRRWDETIKPVCQEFFGESPRLGVIMVGVTAFLPDNLIRRILKSIYAWVAPGSYLSVTNIDAETIRATPGIYIRYVIFKLIYLLVGNRHHIRTDAGLKALMLPWRVVKVVPIFPGNPELSPGQKAYASGYIAMKL
ncbi:MAG: hypothetical protein DRI61_03005 [Chloroflexi bacterium]|nr:MAG: hypothetical protein DRI61_03005 [Chloroflexota bacterium]HDN79846.1 hypothetical protein [Chloroflexota bacterium]